MTRGTGWFCRPNALVRKRFAAAAWRFWQVPLDAYPRLEQGGIILKSSKNLETARAFRDFVLGAPMGAKF
jgi:hypothetical protein